MATACDARRNASQQENTIKFRVSCADDSKTKNKMTDLEIKLVTLALDGGAQPGEIANAAEMFFKELRKRSVKVQDFTRNGSSAGYSDSQYATLYQQERILSAKYRIEAADAQKEAVELKLKIDELTRKLNERHAAGPPEVLSDLEWTILKRMCEYWGYLGFRDSMPTKSVTYSNNERGCLATLICKGFIEKRFDGRVGITETGLEYYQNRIAKGAA
jgi:hypothetical protein